MQIVAVDWSGKEERAEESIWAAHVRDRTLVDLYSGLSREQLVKRLIEVTRAEPRTVIGLDFAFSFPRWWCDDQGWSSGRQVWEAMAKDGEHLLASCEPPFWGRPGKPNQNPAERRYRRTEGEIDEGSPKSVFQIGGSGAVGTGSVRGMPQLLTLAEHELSIWPFQAGGLPCVVEIYPRALTGPVRKSRWTDRHRHLHERFPDQPKDLIERAAGSEDAFDAAVSGLVMGEHEDEFAELTKASDPHFRIEGRIWQPRRAA